MQTWKDRNIPDKWKTSPQAIRKFYPNAKYVLLTHEDIRNFMLNNFPNYMQVFDNLPKQICRIDMFRYAWLYVNGGVYMDLDYELIKPLDFLERDKGIFISRERTVPSYYTNSFLASHKHCDFWLYCLSEIVKRFNNKPFYIIDDFRVLYITGPIMITHVVNHYPGVINIISYHYLMPCDYGKGSCDYRLSYRLDLTGDSWTGSFIKIVRNIHAYKEQVIVVVVLVVILIVCLCLLEKK